MTGHAMGSSLLIGFVEGGRVIRRRLRSPRREHLEAADVEGAAQKRRLGGRLDRFWLQMNL